jgi:hypothetical protein
MRKLPLLAGFAFVICLSGSVTPQEELPIYTDVTAQAGITFVHSFGDGKLDNIVETTGAGCAFFDYNNDGYLDIYLVNGCYHPVVSHPSGRHLAGKLKNALYRNNGNGTFTDVSQEAGVADEGFGMGAYAGDYDNDGWLDLFVTNYGRDSLYHNNGDGTFTDVTQKAGVGSELWGIGATWLDYDNDGWLDLYVGNYLTYDPDYRYFYAAENFPGPLSYKGQPDVLYRNKGNGTFEDVTQKAGVYNPEGRAMGITSGDFDDDGDMDIFVSNDAMANYLYVNKGDGTFNEVALLSGTAFGESGDATSAMGPEFGDIDRDGLMDITVPDLSYGCIYRNLGNYVFEERSNLMGVAPVVGQYESWAGNLFDYDNDGYLDFFISNGNPHRLEEQEDVLFWNDHGKRFVDVSAKSGYYFQQEYIGRGAAQGDYDNDGDLDLLILNLNGPAILLRNDGGNRSNWLNIRTVGTKSNRCGIGTRIRLTAGDLTQIAVVRSGSSYLSTSDIRVCFGLGKEAGASKIQVVWPSGRTQVMNGVKANQFLTIEEPME